jgi:hypothetical protein
VKTSAKAFLVVKPQHPGPEELDWFVAVMMMFVSQDDLRHKLEPKRSAGSAPAKEPAPRSRGQAHFMPLPGGVSRATASDPKILPRQRLR